jgi:transposase
MSEKERRCHLQQMALDGRITVKDAGELMGVSYRHAKRLKRRYDLDGARGIMHGNRGKSPPNAFPQEVRDHILEIFPGKV